MEGESPQPALAAGNPGELILWFPSASMSEGRRRPVSQFKDRQASYSGLLFYSGLEGVE